MSEITFDNRHLYLSARIEGTWLFVMHKCLPYRDFCDATTSFHCIGYAYTKDAPQECIDMGEALWASLLSKWGGMDRNGEKVVVGVWEMNTVTRRRELWSK